MGLGSPIIFLIPASQPIYDLFRSEEKESFENNVKDNAREKQIQRINYDDRLIFVKAQKCNDPHSVTCCDTMETGHTVQSTTTGRHYLIKSMSGHFMANCKSRFLIYVITCSVCSLQYVGQTGEQLNARLSGHVADQHRVFENFVAGGGTKYCCPHFKVNCKGAKMRIQPLEVYGPNGIAVKLNERQGASDDTDGLWDIGVSRKDVRSFLGERETFWIRELRTAYPYGLNDRLDNCVKQPTVYGTFCHQRERINENDHLIKKLKKYSQRKKRKIEKKLDVEQKQEEIKQDPPDIMLDWSEAIFLYDLEVFIDSKSWVRLVTTRVIGLSKGKLRRVLRFSYIRRKDVSANVQQLIDVVIDICRFQLKLNDMDDKSNKEGPKWRLNLKFLNDGFNHCGITKFLHDPAVIALLPEPLRPDVPSIVYSYIPPIRNKILNYYDTIKKEAMTDPTTLPCICAGNPFSNTDLGHIATGDLNIIPEEQVKTLFGKGPKFREKRKTDKKEVLSEIESGLANLISTWGSTFPGMSQYEEENLQPWADKILFLVKTRLELIPLTTVEPEILNNPACIEHIKILHHYFVATVADKSEGNVTLVCKRFYMTRLLDELENDVGANGQRTYAKTNRTPQQVVDSLVLDMNNAGITVDDIHKCLAFVYWTTKMHKTPISQRFIAASYKCVTKPLSAMLCKCLKLVETTLRRKDEYHFARTGTRRFWIVISSDEVINRLNELNLERLVTKLASFDFAKLFTRIVHGDLRNGMSIAVTEAFKWAGFTYMRVGRGKFATWCNEIRPKDNAKFLDCNTPISLINLLIDSIYVTLGERVYKQDIGIPMGTDSAPFISNLYLYSKESVWMDRMIENKEYTIAKAQSNNLRYQDDALSPTGGDYLAQHWTDIYPSSLELTQENKEEHTTHFLDLQLTVNDKKVLMSTYDKRDSFPFQVVCFPDLSGNICFERTHNVIIGQLGRYSRSCDRLEHFKTRIQQLTTRLLTQTFDKIKLRKICRKFFWDNSELMIKYSLKGSNDIDEACFCP